MVLAHQYLGQLSSGLAEALEANTAIKLAGGVSARDARALSSQMGTNSEVIERQGKGSFATFIRGLTKTAISMRTPFFVLEDMPQTSKAEREAIKDASRERYAEAWQAEAPKPETEETDKSEDEKPDDPDPLTPSPEL